jgi:hypothetical protein
VTVAQLSSGVTGVGSKAQERQDDEQLAVANVIPVSPNQDLRLLEGGCGELWVDLGLACG